MTRLKSLEVECPKCEIKDEAMGWDSINVTVDPDLREKLFQGKINVFQCKNYGNKVFIDIPLLYHDMEKRFCVQFYPFSWLDYDNFFEGFNKEGRLDVRRLPKKLRGYFKQTQDVFDPTELLRYIIFRDKLHEKWEKAS